VFPAIALAEAFLVLCPGGSVSFVGTTAGLEAKAVPARGFEIDYVPAGQVLGKGAGGLRGAAKMIGGVGAGMSVVRRRRPDLVFGVGGYASVPVALAACLSRVPLFLQEQNSVPGRSNRMLGRLARRVYAGFAGAAAYFPEGRTVVSGNPVRREIVAAAAQARGRPLEGPFTVFAMGGSQGAAAINDLAIALGRTVNRTGRAMRFIVQTGAAGFPAVERAAREEGLPVEPFPFTERIGEIFQRCHALLMRAGALSIAEASLFAKPCVLIPYPFAADRHQEKNAEEFRRGGGGVWIRQEDASPEAVLAVLSAWADDPVGRRAAEEGSASFARPDAASAIIRSALAEIWGEGEARV
jgi:UDP-N-acetylglucosamine--N-acetylmuramyl-(pentapeptide) pyrophosphoryl-undecaprenol N-acetylglucosamine transferase